MPIVFGAGEGYAWLGVSSSCRLMYWSTVSMGYTAVVSESNENGSSFMSKSVTVAHSSNSNSCTSRGMASWFPTWHAFGAGIIVVVGDNKALGVS